MNTRPQYETDKKRVWQLLQIPRLFVALYDQWIKSSQTGFQRKDWSVMQRIRITIVALFLLAPVAFMTLPISRASETKPPAKNITFSKDVAPILFKSCAECHRPGEAAPMPLLSYKDTRPWARSIREKVVTREMPPWHADPRHGEFKNDRRLTQTEIDTITAWVDNGAPEGDPRELPTLPKFVEGWSIGQPDLVLQMPEEFTLGATGPDEYQYFTLPTNFTEDRYIQAIEARPGNRKIVHHLLAFIDPHDKPGQPKLSQEEAAKLRAQAEKESIFYQDGFLLRLNADTPVHNDGCQLPNGGAGLLRDVTKRNQMWTFLTGFAPGHVADVLEPGTVKLIPAGAKIILQVHYSKAAGSVQKDRSSIGLIFAKNQKDQKGQKGQKDKPFKLLATELVYNAYFQIPPGAAHHKATACWTSPQDIHLTAILPHMHLRGAEMEVKAVYPDGREEVLLNVPKYDFSWQTNYSLKQPRAIPKGTLFVVTGYFDNSSKNRYNPDSTKAVRWGEPTYDEMMSCFLEYTKDAEPTAAFTGGQTSRR
jgi:hypothetical protein